MKWKRIVSIVVASAIGGYSFSMMNVQPKTQNQDLCEIKDGPVTNVVGQTLSLKDATLPGRVSVLLGSPSSECTISVTMHRSQMNFIIGDLISVDGVASPFGVTAQYITRNPSKAYTMDGQSGLDVVEGTFSWRDAIRVRGSDPKDSTIPFRYEMVTLKGDLVLSQDMIHIILRYNDPTKLRITFDRNNLVTSIQPI